MKANIASCDLGALADQCDGEVDRFAAGRGQKCVRRGAADSAAVTPGLSQACGRLQMGANASFAGQR
jgi:hypothetical protein